MHAATKVVASAATALPASAHIPPAIPSPMVVVLVVPDPVMRRRLSTLIGKLCARDPGAVVVVEATAADAEALRHTIHHRTVTLTPPLSMRTK
jgi:hypothetical protein